MTGEPCIYDHATRIALIEQNCEKCPTSFESIAKTLAEIQKSIMDLKLENARNNGIKSLILGASGGGGILGAIKLVNYFISPK